jgi:hypothetical protein
MKTSITVPTSLNDITLKQYKEFASLKDLTDTQLQIETIKIFCNIPYVSIRRMRADDITSITAQIFDILENKSILINRFKMDGIEYGFIPNLDDMSFGEYVDLDTYIGKWEEIEKAMAVLYRPVTLKKGDKYIIEEYEPGNFQIYNNMPLGIVFGSVVFFYNLGIDLCKVMTSYIQKADKDNLMEQQILLESMDGITPFMHSLKATLQDLKISLN